MPRLLTLLTFAALSLLVLGAVLVAQEAPCASSDLVGTQLGQLPIILSAPHGGLKAIQGVPERKGEGLVKGPSGFVIARDGGTEDLAYQLAQAIEAKFGNKPYYVVARFHRKYIDPNRPRDIAYESPKATPVYDAYHQALSRYCREVQRKFGCGLLLDLHGQATAADTIFRGTQNGKTVSLLVQRYGPRAQNGPDSFFGLLAARGCKVYPTQEGQREQAGFTGGYIVRTYGSHQGEGIDAIQLEFGGDYRDKSRQHDTALKVADSVAEFAKLYLPAKAP
jgi:N-formylglutamate amidohydrolase